MRRLENNEVILCRCVGGVRRPPASTRQKTIAQLDQLKTAAQELTWYSNHLTLRFLFRLVNLHLYNSIFMLVSMASYSSLIICIGTCLASYTHHGLFVQRALERWMHLAQEPWLSKHSARAARLLKRVRRSLQRKKHTERERLISKHYARVPWQV